MDEHLLPFGLGFGNSKDAVFQATFTRGKFTTEIWVITCILWSDVTMFEWAFDFFKSIGLTSIKRVIDTTIRSSTQEGMADGDMESHRAYCKFRVSCSGLVVYVCVKGLGLTL